MSGRAHIFNNIFHRLLDPLSVMGHWRGACRAITGDAPLTRHAASLAAVARNSSSTISREEAQKLHVAAIEHPQ